MNFLASASIDKYPSTDVGGTTEPYELLPTAVWGFLTVALSIAVLALAVLGLRHLLRGVPGAQAYVYSVAILATIVALALYLWGYGTALVDGDIVVVAFALTLCVLGVVGFRVALQRMFGARPIRPVALYALGTVALVSLLVSDALFMGMWSMSWWMDGETVIDTGA